jgi:hypothetical protein
MSDSSVEKRIRNLSDDELINIVEREFKSYTSEAISIASDEIDKRGIRQKPIWYYRKGSEQYGPISRQEIIQLVNEGEINKYDYLWRAGWEMWVRVDDVEGLDCTREPLTPPPFTPGPPPYVPQQFPQANINSFPAALKACSILFFVISGIWSVIVFSQISFAVTFNASTYAILAVMNGVFVIIAIVIGVSIWRARYFGYSWGVGTSVLNIILFIIQYIIASSPIMLVCIILFIATLVILLVNKEYFILSKESDYTHSI